MPDSRPDPPEVVGFCERVRVHEGKGCPCGRDLSAFKKRPRERRKRGERQAGSRKEGTGTDIFQGVQMADCHAKALSIPGIGRAKEAVRCHLTPFRMATIQSNRKKQVLGSSVHCWWEWKLVQLL